ncbi:MAG: hypothetical protein MZV63_63015 [Marinilabiliales bacterium]|nr:hypothetical protein [Marinilabiliales bacterium]
MGGGGGGGGGGLGGLVLPASQGPRRRRGPRRRSRPCPRNRVCSWVSTPFLLAFVAPIIAQNMPAVSCRRAPCSPGGLQRMSIPASTGLYPAAVLKRHRMASTDFTYERSPAKRCRVPKRIRARGELHDAVIGIMPGSSDRALAGLRRRLRHGGRGAAAKPAATRPSMDKPHGWPKPSALARRGPFHRPAGGSADLRRGPGACRGERAARLRTLPRSAGHRAGAPPPGALGHPHRTATAAPGSMSRPGPLPALARARRRAAQQDQGQPGHRPDRRPGRSTHSSTGSTPGSRTSTGNSRPRPRTDDSRGGAAPGPAVREFGFKFTGQARIGAVLQDLHAGLAARGLPGRRLARPSIPRELETLLLARRRQDSRRSIIISARRRSWPGMLLTAGTPLSGRLTSTSPSSLVRPHLPGQGRLPDGGARDCLEWNEKALALLPAYRDAPARQGPGPRLPRPQRRGPVRPRPARSSSAHIIWAKAITGRPGTSTSSAGSRKRAGARSRRPRSSSSASPKS